MCWAWSWEVWSHMSANLFFYFSLCVHIFYLLILFLFIFTNLFYSFIYLFVYCHIYFVILLQISFFFIEHLWFHRAPLTGSQKWLGDGLTLLIWLFHGIYWQQNIEKFQSHQIFEPKYFKINSTTKTWAKNETKHGGCSNPFYCCECKLLHATIVWWAKIKPGMSNKNVSSQREFISILCRNQWR